MAHSNGASFVVGAFCEWGSSKKITKAALKLKPCFRSHRLTEGLLFRFLPFYWGKDVSGLHVGTACGRWQASTRLSKTATVVRR